MQTSSRTALSRAVRLLRASCPEIRPFSTTCSNDREVGNKEGFFSAFFAPKVEIQHTAHSQSLASSERLIEFQIHDVRPDRVDDYESAQKTLVQFVGDNRGSSGLQLNAAPVGHFEVILGNSDQFVHVWQYEGGNAAVDHDLLALKTSREYKMLVKEVSKHVLNRSNQVLMPFDFWPPVTQRRDRLHIYEMRDYHLKPGTMIEWGNYWAKAIRMRDYKHNEAFLGMFSQIGELYNVKHIWCYESLLDRKEAREAVWQKQQQQWRDVIEGTMPLIQQMSSRVMISLDYSPTI